MPVLPSAAGRRPAGKVLLSILVASLAAAASVAVATLVIQQPFIATPASHAPPVTFVAGDDVASLVSYGFATAPAITGAGSAAAMTIYGVPGATSVALGEILELQNTEALSGGNTYAVTLSSSSLPAGVTSLVLAFTDDVSGTPTARSWSVASGPVTYNLSPQETWELSATLVMPASGALSAITISASITPV